LKAFSVLLQAMEKAHKKGHGGAGEGGLAAVKAPDMEVSLRFSESQISEVLTLESAGSGLCLLFTDHLGLLSQSPAFPEIVAPVLMNLRRFGKHCRSEPLRRQLKQLATACETSADSVRARREALTEAPSFRKFLVFDSDSAVARARMGMLQRKAAEEKSRVEAELREAKAAAGTPGAKGRRKKGDVDAAVAEAEPEQEEENGADAAASSDPQGKRKAQQARRKDKKKQQKLAKEQEAKRRLPGAIAAEARRAGAKPDRDVVEEMKF